MMEIKLLYKSTILRKAGIFLLSLILFSCSTTPTSISYGKTLYIDKEFPVIYGNEYIINEREGVTVR